MQPEKKQPDTADKSAKGSEPAQATKEAESGSAADVQLTQEGAGEAASSTGELVAYKPPPKKPQPKIKDTPGLMKILDEALIKGDESKLSYAVMGIEKTAMTLLIT